MAGYHNLTIVGNVGADPTVTQTQWGPVTNFDIAVNGRHNPPIWYSISAWGKLGEAMAQYLTKGREVLIESDHFEPVWALRRTGEVVTRNNVRASRVVFLDGGAPDKPQQQRQYNNGNQQHQAAAPQRQAAAPQRQAQQPQRQYNNGNQQQGHNGTNQQGSQHESQWDNLTNEDMAQEIPF